MEQEQVQAYMEKRVQLFVNVNGEGEVSVNVTALADDASLHFSGLCAPDTSVQPWVFAAAALVAKQWLEQQRERERREAFYVEKPIRYEADGDCIWA